MIKRIYFSIPVTPNITHFQSAQLRGYLIVNTASKQNAPKRLEVLPNLSEQALEYLLRNASYTKIKEV